MQYKYPELLWALLLLLIPIIIHLVQLRRFKKTPFTNVRLLKQVTAQSSKTNTLKKWLLLTARLLLLACLVMAFAQPFIASYSALQDKETVIYLDNSFSMQAKGRNGMLMENAIQDLLREVPEDASFNLFTNSKEFPKTDVRSLQNDLLTLPPTHQQLGVKEIKLKAAKYFSENENAIKNLVVISDFQERIRNENETDSSKINLQYVPLRPENNTNISLDSLIISNASPTQIELTVLLSATGESETVPVSLFNGETLIAKSAALFEGVTQAEVVFTLSADEVVDGRIEISDAGLPYDNQLYFTIAPKEKIKVLAISEADHQFLNRIYTSDEFQFQNTSLQQLNYGEITASNLIVLNEIQDIPTPLQNALHSFEEEGGHLLIIPHANANLPSYNQFLNRFQNTRFSFPEGSDIKITEIAFEHPIYKDVFEREVSNFDYPEVASYYTISGGLSKILGFQNGAPFLSGDGSCYIFSAAISGEFSNFKRSPLIVPTLYAVGINSYNRPSLYNTISNFSEIDIKWNPGQDNILKVHNESFEFIPLQRSFANKTTLSFTEDPTEAGTYSVKAGEDTLLKLSFNYPRQESNLSYMDIEDLSNGRVSNNIEELFSRLEKEDKVTELWKWFVILALFFLLMEVLIQKFIK